LDAFRGLLVVLMALNHVPTNLDDFTNHPLGFVSSAEGFVFLSGLIGGYVYVRKIWRDGFAHARSCCWLRAGTIYGYHVAAFLMVFAWIGVFTLANDGTLPGVTPPLMANHPAMAVWSGLALLYQPSLFDVLPIYFLMLLLLPGVLWALERGYRGTVLAISLSVWALTNSLFAQTPYTNLWVQFGVFNPLAWQVLFVVGAIFGQAWAQGLKPPAASRWFVLGAIGFALALFGIRHALISVDSLGASLGLSGSSLLSVHQSLDWLTNKNNLAPLRLLNAAVLFYLAYLAVSRWPRAFHWQPLAFLGRHALPVFAAHILVAYFINSLPEVFAQSVAERWLSTVLMVLSLFAVASLHAYVLGTRRQTGVALRPFPRKLPSTSESAVFKMFSR
jgi:hypothetical protein